MATTIAGGGGSSFINILTATTTVVVARSARLRRIVFNKKVINGVVTIYDNASAASGTKVGTITNPGTLLENSGTLEYDVFCQNGIVVVTSSTDDITVVWD